MCGFAALISPPAAPPVDADRLARMGATLAHRGPDDAGTWADARAGVVFRRLSIIDLSCAGHQPMQTEDGRVTLVFNGEVYNYRALRDELRAAGHAFRSESDTEVLLRAYLEWGSACVERLNGMYAFCVVDRRRDVVFGARDRFGVKPLYAATLPNGQLAYASEIKALRALGAGAEPDWARVSEWLVGPSLDNIPARGRTFFAGVREVPPATAFEVTADGRAREWRYWSLDGVTRRPVAEARDAGEEYAALFEDAIRLEARADVPVGVSLSGGLDSTAIACALARQSGTTLEAFCYMSEQHDERRYIEATLAQTGAHLNVVPVTPEGLFDNLDALLAVHDEPVHTLTAAIGAEIMRAARARGITVMLNGQGADEVLAGYSSYFADYWADLVRHGDEARARQEIADYAAVHGGDPAALLEAARRRSVRLARRGRFPLMTLASRGKTWVRGRRRREFTPELLRHLPLPVPEDEGNGLTGALRRSTDETTLPFYLRVEDRNSMAHSVEARVPFLDHRLVELAFALPESWLLRGPWNKFVLREALRGRAPEVVHRRADKMGFAHPARAWFRGPLAGRVESVLATPVAGDLYDVAWARRLLAEHRAGAADHSDLLFRLVQLERWTAVVVRQGAGAFGATRAGAPNGGPPAVAAA